MNGKDIFTGLKYIGSDLIEKAETGQFPEDERRDFLPEPKPRKLVVRKEAAPSRPRLTRRPVFIAAVIALMVFLVGCTAVVLLRLDKLRASQESYVTKTRYSEDGTKLLPTEKLRGTYILAGETGKARPAVQAWIDFLREWDPEGTKGKDAYASGTGDAYEKTLDDKRAEICKTYGLPQVGERLVIQSDTALFTQLLGMDRLITADGALDAPLDGGWFYACGNFSACYPNTVLKGSDSGEDLTFMMIYSYWDGNYFDSSAQLVIHDEDAVQEWNHTLPGGENVLIVMDAVGDSYILYDRGDAFISVQVYNVGLDWLNPADVMTHRDMERIADSLILTPKPEEISNISQLQAEVDEEYRAAVDETEPPEVVAERKRVYEENECLDSFSALITRMRDHEDYFTSHKSGDFENFWDTMNYTLLDVTGDGEEDLLLGKDGHIRSIWSMVDGKTKCIAQADVGVLCEGNILWDYHYLDGAGYNWYRRLDQGDYMVPILDVEYSVYDETWWKYDMVQDPSGATREAISEEEMQKIVDSYTPVSLDWKSVKEFS